MRQGAGGGVSDDLLDDRVVAVLAFGLAHLKPAGDKDGVVAPEVEQFLLPGRIPEVERVTRRTINRPLTCSLVGREVNAV